MKRSLTLLLWLVAVATYLALGWIPGVILALVAVVAAIRMLVGTARELAPTVRCPRGHVVPTYGRTRCSACGFDSEGSVWWCRHCDARYGHTPCPHCGLSTKNPAL